jgi:FO synthase subunit 2
MISAIGRTPAERSTDYRQIREVDPDESPVGPQLGPRADGTPLVE